jgi:hypothetical protein
VLFPSQQVRDTVLKSGMERGATHSFDKLAELSGESMNKKTLKSIGAVLACFLVVVVLSIATDMVLHAAGVFPAVCQTMADSLFALATAYRTLYSIAGGYMAARLAPDRPWRMPWRSASWALLWVFWALW